MNQIGPVIAASGSLALLYAERLLNGVTQSNYARFARPGGVEVRSNHVAFVLGHLSLYPPRVLQNLGQAIPERLTAPGYEALFKAGVECRDDPDGGIYPPLNELSARFFDGHRAAIAAVSAARDDALLAPNPAEGRMRELFPTIGAALNFYVSGHVQNHLGQVSAWRRALGLPAA